MNKPFKISYDLVLIFIAFAAAGGLRFFQLGALPLGDVEAQNAMQAFNLSKGQPSLFQTDQSLYLVLTTALFSVFRSTNFLARFIPALSGTLIVFAPWLLKKWIGRNPALILSFLLAFEPSLVAVSRIAGAESMAYSLLAFTAVACLNRNYWLAGAFIGAGILCGPTFWLGALIVGLAIAFLAAFRRKSLEPVFADFGPSRTETRTGMIWAFGSVFVLGSLVLLVPQGLSSAGLGFVNFIQGWTKPSDLPVLFPLLGLAAYQPVGLLFGIGQSVQAVRQRHGGELFFVIWWLIALAVVIVYPARAMSQVGWVAIPLLTLAATRLSSVLADGFKNIRATLVIGGGVFVLSVSFWLNLLLLNQLGMPGPFTGEQNATLRWVWFVAAIALMGVVLYFGQLTWPGSALRGAVWGWGFFLVLLGISLTWSAAGLGAYPETQIWRKDPLIGEEDLFAKTLHDYSGWVTGVQDAVEIVVQNVNTPSMYWELRNYPNAIFATTLPVDANPTILVTPDQPTVSLTAAYRGQDFTWNEKPAWSLMLADEWLNWWVYKKAPLETLAVLIWVRADVFPDMTTVE